MDYNIKQAKPNRCILPGEEHSNRYQPLKYVAGAAVAVGLFYTIITQGCNALDRESEAKAKEMAPLINALQQSEVDKARERDAPTRILHPVGPGYDVFNDNNLETTVNSDN